MTCQYCETGSCYKHEKEYEEFVPNKEYPVGGFFKIGREVFKVVKYTGDAFRCDVCEFDDVRYQEYCENGCCTDIERQEPVYFILYDTLDDDEL